MKVTPFFIQLSTSLISVSKTAFC